MGFACRLSNGRAGVRAPTFRIREENWLGSRAVKQRSRPQAQVGLSFEDFKPTAGLVPAVFLGQNIAKLCFCQAGNVRTAVLVLNLALKNDCYDRFLIATDTPTGVGVMPEGMIKSIAEMASLTDCAPEKVIAAATGNAASVSSLLSARRV